MLENAGPPDLTELVLGASSYLLALSDLGVDHAEGRRLAEEAVSSGAARELYDRWVRAQGGNPSREALPRAAVVRTVAAPTGGFVEGIATTGIGLAALRLGAGRLHKEHAIDHAVGVVCLAKRGDRVEAGQALAEIHARDAGSADRAANEVEACYRLGDRKPEPKAIVLDVVS
jgi:thymidine phosphorylase